MGQPKDAPEWDDASPRHLGVCGLPTRSWDIPHPILPADTPNIPMIQSSLQPVILNQFYRKVKSNKTPMQEKSANPLKSKIQTATNEFLRKMTNTSRLLPRDNLESIIRTYFNDFKRGGFSQNFVVEA